MLDDFDNAAPSCDLCGTPGGKPLWSSPAWRIVRVEDNVFYPAFYRVIANAHVAELTDLDVVERRRSLDLVCAIERVLRTELSPTKINIATLGNMTPHVHWHVIARFANDAHFPQPIWGTPQRADPQPSARLRIPLDKLDAAIVAAVNG